MLGLMARPEGVGRPGNNKRPAHAGTMAAVTALNTTTRASGRHDLATNVATGSGWLRVSLALDTGLDLTESQASGRT